MKDHASEAATRFNSAWRVGSSSAVKMVLSALASSDWLLSSTTNSAPNGWFPFFLKALVRRFRSPA